jgi:probable rRNA maturation factor
MSILHQIEIQMEVPLEDVDLTLLKVAALAVLKQQGVEEPSEITIVITDDEALRDLNQRFRGINRPTDVLSFPDDTRGPFAVGAEGFPRYLGTSSSHCRVLLRRRRLWLRCRGGTPVLIVHGTLHLLGTITPILRKSHRCGCTGGHS